MTRFYETDHEGHLLPAIHPVNPAFRTLLSQGETITELIDRTIENLPPNTKRFEFEITAKKDKDGKDVVTVATGFRTSNDWTVILAGEFFKDDKTVRLQIGKEWT